VSSSTVPARTRRIVGLFPELLGVGGVQEAGRLTAAALRQIAAEKHWSFEFLCLNDSPGRHSLAVAGTEIPFYGFGRAKARFVFSTALRARHSSRKADLIVLAAHPNLAVPAQWMRRAAPRTKVLAVAHGIEVWEPLSMGRRRALCRADRVLAPSSYTIQKLIEVQGVAAQKAVRLPWPLSPNLLRLAESPEKLRVPDGFPAGRIILTVGRWVSNERYKGADALIRSIPGLLQAMPDLQFVAIGAGDDLPRLRALASEQGIAGRAHFFENLPPEKIAACYAASEIFALPSTGEGFGLVFLEAMAFGKPVIGVAAGGATDVVENGVNGVLLPSQDPGALANAIEHLLGGAALRTELGRNGARIAREQYSFAAFREGLTGILDAVVAGEPA
jgi:phosphatidylinositol alpha-1,6-mannosyltransferase